MSSSTIRRAVATVVLAATAAAVVVAASATGSAAAPGSAGNADLASVRAATAKYHDVEVAKGDGYVEVSPCEQNASGVMGIHFLHPQLAQDAVIDPHRPEVLLYVPTATGYRLVGVEYFIAEAAAPWGASVLGRDFDGPMAGHGPGMPRHYDLHLWLWKHNPAGMTAQYNPSASCDGGAR